MNPRRFLQVDVFGSQPLEGNPLAVVVDAEGLSDAQMQHVARWTNLSETVFLLPPERPGAVYRVRIFTLARKLDFAGHPTLGSAHPLSTGSLDIGIVGPHHEGSPVELEIRALFIDDAGGLREDPVTGSLNASVAQWLLGTGRVEAPFTARQGTCLGRDGRVHVDVDDGHVWVGGETTTLIEGTIDL